METNFKQSQGPEYSGEQPQHSPPYNREDYNQIALEYVRSCPGLVVSEPLNPGEPIAVSPHATSIEPEVTFNTEGDSDPLRRIEQDLRTVVYAGGELFGIVKIERYMTENKDLKLSPAVLVTRVGSENVDLIGVVNPGGGELVIGRSDKSRDYNKALSREHFSIAVGEQGDITITDLRSTNGTRLISGRLEEGAIARQSGKYSREFMTKEELEVAQGRGVLKALRKATRSGVRVFEETSRTAPQPGNPFHEARVIGRWFLSHEKASQALRSR